jgi:hypothetical protein
MECGCREYLGNTVFSFRAFLSHEGVCEVFDFYNLPQSQRDAITNELMPDDEEIFPSEGGSFDETGEVVM